VNLKRYPHFYVHALGEVPHRHFNFLNHKMAADAWAAARAAAGWPAAAVGT